jgi:hypothetical protein
MLFLFFSLERYWPSLSVRNELLCVLILFHFESAVLFPASSNLKVLAALATRLA